MSETLGRVIGNWNDRRSRHDSRKDASVGYRVVDRLAGWLYTRSER